MRTYLRKFCESAP